VLAGATTLCRQKNMLPGASRCRNMLANVKGVARCKKNMFEGEKGVRYKTTC